MFIQAYYVMLGTLLNTLHRYLNLILIQLSEQGIVVSIFQIRDPKLEKFISQIERGQIQTLYWISEI